MPSEVRRYIVYTTLGEAAADFEARMAGMGASAVADQGDGRRFYVYTDEGAQLNDLEARLSAFAGYVAPSDTSLPDQMYPVWTMKGEAAANLEQRLLALST